MGSPLFVTQLCWGPFLCLEMLKDTLLPPPPTPPHSQPQDPRLSSLPLLPLLSLGLSDSGCLGFLNSLSLLVMLNQCGLMSPQESEGEVRRGCGQPALGQFCFEQRGSCTDTGENSSPCHGNLVHKRKAATLNKCLVQDYLGKHSQLYGSATLCLQSASSRP